ncbi:MAG TPA: malto-oligosyltrehalose trehalohydrolase [Chitinophaga sp.]
MITRSYKRHGAILNGPGECMFRVWAPFREKVTLLLPETKQWQYDMQRDHDGYWEVLVRDVNPGMRYYYQLDNELQRPDPASRCQPEGVHGPSAVTDPYSFVFTDDHWQGMDLPDMIIYELHVGTFTPEGTLKAAEARLPALLELGITAVEIMPAAQFPGNRNWGYDGVYPYALHNTYGCPEDLKSFVNRAHQLGIAVLLDVVYNHLGPEGNYFNDYGPYFTDRYKTPWGRAINFDDANCDPVRGFFIHNALMWLEEFQIDGLRLDAVHACWDTGALHIVQELAEAVRRLERRAGRKKVLIAELDLNSPRYVTAIDKGGYGLQGQWVDEFHHALHSCLTGERNGYYADFGELRQLAKSYEDAYVYTGQYSPGRRRRFGLPPDNLPYSRFVTFIQNHDHVGNRMLGERLSSLLPFEGLKLAAAALLLSPFVPLLFMGEEYGEPRPFLFFCSFEDPGLINAVREGRKQEFADFHSAGIAPDPQSAQTFEASLLSWDLQQVKSVALRAWYRQLISFRKTRPAMRNFSRSGTKVKALQNNALLVLERTDEVYEDRLLILLNFSREEQIYTSTPAQRLKKLFDSAATQWNDPGAMAPGSAEGGDVHIPPLSAVVYEMKLL